MLLHRARHRRSAARRARSPRPRAVDSAQRAREAERRTVGPSGKPEFGLSCSWRSGGRRGGHHLAFAILLDGDGPWLLIKDTLEVPGGAGQAADGGLAARRPAPPPRQKRGREARDLPVAHAGTLWAARRWFRHDRALSAKFSRILRDIYAEFGPKSRVAAPLVGRYLRFMMEREDRRLRRGWTYEPPTFCESQRGMITPRHSGRSGIVNQCAVATD